MLTAVLAIFVLAAVLPLAYRRWPGVVWLAPLLATLEVAWFARYAPAVARGQILAESTPWAPSVGVSASFVLDGLSLTLALLVLGVGALVLFYSPAYLHDRARLGTFVGLLLAFMGSMLGLVLADDLLVFYVFWELTSLSSFFLIGFEKTAEARRSAWEALLVTAAGGLALLVAILLLRSAGAEAGLAAEAAGRFSGLGGANVRDAALYPWILGLVAFGAFTKSAHWPLHFWLPDAMVAPTPVSAYLHSATMVKAGVFLLARVHPILGDTTGWFWLLVGAGAATMVTGGSIAIFQRDLKRLLAYATISVLGGLTFLLGIGTDKALEAFFVLLVAHALYKSALFLVTGGLQHATGGRDIWKLRGLGLRLPAIAVAAWLAAASMAGLPPALGFVAKEALLASGVTGTWVLGGLAFLGGSLLATLALLVALAPFLGGAASSGPLEKVPLPMVLAPLLLASGGLILGVWLAPLEALARATASTIASGHVEVELALWHGTEHPHGLVLAMSLGSLTLAALVYWRLAARGGPPARALLPSALQGSELYARAFQSLFGGAKTFTARLQNGSLRFYLLVILGTALTAAILPLIASPPPLAAWGELPRAYELLVVALAGAGALAATWAADRLVVVAALGLTGLGIAFLFALLSAPDLAIAQLMVEFLLVVLLVFIFRRIPPATSGHPTVLRIAHGVLAVGAGTVVALLVLSAGASPAFPPDAAGFFLAKALEEGSGNVVNAILIEFRSLDTLGEITVLALAALGVGGLLRARAREEG